MVCQGYAVKTDHDLKQLRHYLQGNGFDTQERLPPERELAATLGLTRNRLRTV